jgi:hypothetical protein
VTPTQTIFRREVSSPPAERLATKPAAAVRYTPCMGSNAGATTGLILLALFLARYLVFHDRALGLARGPARVVAGVVFALALVGARLLARRR